MRGTSSEAGILSSSRLPCSQLIKMSSLVLRATHHFFIFLYNSLYPAGLILGPIFSYSLWVEIFFPSAWVTRKMDPYPSLNYYSLPRMRLPVSAPHNHDQSGHFSSLSGFGGQQIMNRCTPWAGTRHCSRSQLYQYQSLQTRAESSLLGLLAMKNNVYWIEWWRWR